MAGDRGDSSSRRRDEAVTPLLEAKNVRKAFSRTEALRGASLSVEAGEVVAVTGPSGSGKSTLLLCLAGVLRPEVGELRYDGRRLDELSERDWTRLRRREFGLVLQFGQLVPELSAEQNVALPLLLERHDRRAAMTAARGWLDRLGATDVAGLLPGEMSGGEAQRVAVARAFGDRAAGRLRRRADRGARHGRRRAGVDRLAGRGPGTSATVLLVTHDNRVAATADREVVLRDGVVSSLPVLP